MRSPALFISIEGGEGAGKSTLMDALEQFFQREGCPVIRTREPGGTPFGEALRQILLGSSHEITPLAEVYLILASRIQHLRDVIFPRMAEGAVVLCDRFNDSTIAYQGGGRELGVERVQKLCTEACFGINPQLTLYLDIPPEEGLQRTRGLDKEHARSGSLDRIEKEEISFHQKVRQAFLELAKREPKRIHTLDATQSKEEVAQEALKIVQAFLREKAHG